MLRVIEIIVQQHAAVLMVDDMLSSISIGCLLLGRLGKAVLDSTPPIRMAYQYQTGMHDI
jgi:hypothetical protein